MKPFRIAAVAALVLVAAAVAGVAQPHFASSADTTPVGAEITVTGTGSVSTVPDRASFSFTVESRAKTATEALTRNNAAARAVSTAVKNAGVSDADIQTSHVSLSPQTKQDGTQIIGYIASNSISVKSTIAKAGSIVDAAVGAGADGVSGPSLSISDQDVQYRDALKQAVAAAHAKAQTLADAAGLSLGGAQTIVEGAGQYPVPLAQKADFSAGVSIQPGTQTVDATVTVTYTAT